MNERLTQPQCTAQTGLQNYIPHSDSVRWLSFYKMRATNQVINQQLILQEPIYFNVFYELQFLITKEVILSLVKTSISCYHSGMTQIHHSSTQGIFILSLIDAPSFFPLTSASHSHFLPPSPKFSFPASCHMCHIPPCPSSKPICVFSM